MAPIIDPLIVHDNAPALALAQVTVIVVTFNSAHCLPVLAQGLADCPHVIIVDNASADGCAALARELLPQARVIELPANQGYGAANNVGIAQADTPYVLLQNPDCVFDAAGIAELVRLAQADPYAAMWVPQLLEPDGRPQINYGMPRHWGEPNSMGAQGPLCVGYACAAALLMHRERMAPVGFFDPRFFLYYEDEDLCLRAFNAKLPIVVLPSVHVIHLSRSSVRGGRPWKAEYWRGWHHAQSKIRFTAKHFGRAQGESLLRRTLAVEVAHLGLRIVLVSPRLVARAWGRVRGLFALWRHKDLLS